MLVKSPLKKKKTKQNTRWSSSSKNNSTQKSGSSSGSNNYGRRKKTKANNLWLPKVAPWKLILGIIGAGLLGLAYLSHVFATQELLAEVQQLEQEYNQAQRAHDSYRLQYDRMIGPAEISEKAKGLGFINGGPAEKVIEVNPE